MPSKYGCRKSPTDVRDLKIVALRAVRAPPPKLPSKVDYTDQMTGVKNQLNEGICVGFASTAMKEYQEKLEQKSEYDFSKRFVYEHARQIDRLPDNDEGTTIRAAMEVLYEQGVCEESCWPYIPHIRGSPCKTVTEDALPFRIKSYIGLDTVSDMKEGLLSNGPFVLGIIVYESFEKDDHGVIPMPKADEEILGGHAICIVGYDDAKRQFKFKNSWGMLWGSGGYGWLSYDYIEPFAFDGWTAADLTAPGPKPRPWWVRLWDWLMRLFKISGTAGAA